MKNLATLIGQEIRCQLYSPATYAAAVLFLLFMIGPYLMSLQEAARAPQESSPPEIFFQVFWIPVLFIVPMLTMRSFAEERHLGTLETTLSTPVQPFELALSKFLGAYLFYLVLWGLTLLFPFIVQWVSPTLVEQGQLLNTSTLAGGYAFIALSGALYTAIGIFTSSLTRSQLIAGMLSFCMLFIFIVGAKMIASVPVASDPGTLSLANVPDYFQTFRHLDDFTRGVIDTRPFFFYISNALLLVGLTSLIVRSKA